ncbi:hypothetical protein SAMN05216226_1072 [Halovenus aranensis]|jgi:hypothetical protein|uniref:Major facilitator superfamily (MFS) profile domain-containing protein n=1 Tax=Halovenus aranensis TaxID=890420 RepID=A0A1G8VKK6_9EURY|nr:hypothetical protein [Halovenus aranensis]SDJ66611.1 hypothetical protein SAMN05216226_1072 [Halovenus aranensis]
MLRNIGFVGIVGLLMLVGGVALAAWVNLLVGGALALVIAGLGLIVYGLVTNLMQAMGMGQLM